MIMLAFFGFLIVLDFVFWDFIVFMDIEGAFDSLFELLLEVAYKDILYKDVRKKSSTFKDSGQESKYRQEKGKMENRR